MRELKSGGRLAVVWLWRRLCFTLRAVSINFYCILIRVSFRWELIFCVIDKSAAIEALLNPLASPYPSSDPSMPHPIDLPHTSRLYKTLLQGGHFSHTTHKITLSPHFSASAFASAFIRIVGEEMTVAIAGGDGAFVVAELLQRVSEEGSESEKSAVKGWFGGDVRRNLQNGKGKGRKVLLEKVTKLA